MSNESTVSSDFDRCSPIVNSVFDCRLSGVCKLQILKRAEGGFNIKHVFEIANRFFMSRFACL